MKRTRLATTFIVAICFTLTVSSSYSQNSINLRRDSVDEGTVTRMKNNLANILKHRDVNPVIISTTLLTRFLKSYTNPVLQFHFALNPSSKEINLYMRLPAGSGFTYLNASTLEPVSPDEAVKRKGALNAALHGNKDKLSKAVLVQVEQLVDLVNRCDNNGVDQMEFEFGAEKIDGDSQPVLYARVPRQAFTELDAAIHQTSNPQFLFATYKDYGEANLAKGFLYLKVGVMCPPPSSCQ